MVLWLKSFFIFPTKLVLKPRSVDLEKNEKIPLLISIICFHKIENWNYRKNVENRQGNFTKNSSRKPPRGIPHVSRSRCQQNLLKTVYRTKIGLIEKNKIRQLTGAKAEGFFLAFSDYQYHKTWKTCFQNCFSRFFDKFIIMNVQNELLYKSSTFSNSLTPKTCFQYFFFFSTKTKIVFDYYKIR